MEHHLSCGPDAMSHVYDYLPLSMLDVGAMLTDMLPLNIRSMVNLIYDHRSNLMVRCQVDHRSDTDRQHVSQHRTHIQHTE